MPTVTDPKTGETREISMEEFLQAVSSGEGTLKQVLTNADGSTSTTVVYGNDSDDGLDRSVNIFTDAQTVSAFGMRKLKKMAGHLPETEPHEEEFYEMLVDFTDDIGMGILRCTKEQLTVEIYDRDPRRSTFSHLLTGKKSWKNIGDNRIDFSLDDLKGSEKGLTMIMLGFAEMRTFLRTSGKLAELKKLGNRGTGVIIKATGYAEDAKATIVRGRQRPDLPCKMLFGVEMMRPYADELLGLDAQKEKRKEEKAVARAAEERKRAEAAKEKSSEEEEYRQTLGRWKKSCADAQARRADEVQRLSHMEKLRLVNAAKRSCEKTAAEQQQVTQREEARKLAALRTFNTLGAFDFSGKKEQKRIISEATAALSEAKKKLEQAKAACEAAEQSAQEQVLRRKAEFEAQAAEKFPDPQLPADFMERFRHLFWRDAILEHMQKDKYYTVEHLMEQVQALEGVSQIRVETVMRDLTRKNKVNVTKRGSLSWYKKI